MRSDDARASDKSLEVNGGALVAIPKPSLDRSADNDGQ